MSRPTIKTTSILFLHRFFIKSFSICTVSTITKPRPLCVAANFPQLIIYDCQRVCVCTFQRPRSSWGRTELCRRPGGMTKALCLGLVGISPMLRGWGWGWGLINPPDQTLHLKCTPHVVPHCCSPPPPRHAP